MPTLPWARAHTTAPPDLRTEPTPAVAAGAAPSAEVLVLGSRLRLARARDVPDFLRAAMAIRRQVRASDGALGVSLLAQPLARTFWTLSAWRDQEAVDAFVRAEPHATVMRRFAGRLAGAEFTTWSVPADQVPTGPLASGPLWAEARRRLAVPQGLVPATGTASGPPVGGEPEAAA